MPNYQRLALPRIGQLAQTYARGAVWSGSTTQDVKFTPLSKRIARQLYYRARTWDAATRTRGKHGGIIGRPGVSVLHSMIFDFLNSKTGRLDPSYEGLAKKTGYSRATVAVALRRLRDAGIITWLRRCIAGMRDGKFVLAQERNAYAILTETSWKGYRAPLTVPTEPTVPEPGTWGDHPALLTALAQAQADQAIGLSQAAVIATLESDPSDSLAAALARMGRGLTARSDRKN
jgi:hypothetical protein